MSERRRGNKAKNSTQAAKDWPLPTNSGTFTPDHDNTLFPLAIFDQQQTIRYVNRALTNLIGFQEDELIGLRPPFPYWPKEKSEVYGQHDPKTDLSEFKLERLFQKKNGEIFWVEIFVIPVQYANETQCRLTIWNDITQLKGAEASLTRSEEKFSSVFNAIPMPLAINSFPDMKFLDVNKSFLETAGISRAEILGQPAFDLKWGSGSDALRTTDILKEKGGFKDVELQLYSSTGDLHTNLLSAELVQVGGQQLVLSASVDITERKKTEEALKESEAFNASLLSNAPFPILVVNLDYSIKYVNPALEKLSGFSMSELIGKKPPYPWWPNQEEGLSQLKQLEGETANTGLEEIQFFNKNRQPFWVELSIRNIKEGEKTRYYLGNWVDITERKKAENGLKESEAFNASLLNDAPNPVLVYNLDSSVRYINPAMEELTGFSTHEVLGAKPPYPWWPPQQIKQFMTEKESHRYLETDHIERQAQKKNGELIWVSISMRLVKEQGQVKYFLANWLDITESKKMQEEIVDLYEKEKAHTEELQEEGRTRGLFIDVLAHELRTPVTPILASTGMLKEMFDAQPDVLQKKLVDNIYVSTQTLARRLEELLDLARYSRGAFNIHVKLTDIHKFLEEVIARFQPTIDQRKQKLVVRIGENLPVSEVDSSRLEQVLINLLSNASKFSPECGTIILQVAASNGNLQVDITDEGIGIPFDEQARLFQPYHRVEQDRQQLPGLGLGLAVSRQIVDAHGGKIWVESQPDKGSTFSFSIPIKR